MVQPAPTRSLSASALSPALPASAAAHPHPLSRAAARGSFGEEACLHALDAVRDGIVAYDLEGRIAFSNRAASEMLAEAPDDRRLQASLRRFVEAVQPHARRMQEGGCPVREEVGEREVTTAVGQVRLRATFVRAIAAADGHLWVGLERVPPAPPSDEELRVAYELTAKEIGVARLMASGRSNGEIARHLWISPHTARHHTERVLRKLGARSRAQVASLLKAS